MPTITVVTRDGEERSLTAQTGVTLMEAIRDGGFDELTAICGGCCSCATCHVHVELIDASRLPAMTADEDELLGLSGDRSTNSRLSCQIPFDGTIDGARVVIAADY